MAKLVLATLFALLVVAASAAKDSKSGDKKGDLLTSEARRSYSVASPYGSDSRDNVRGDSDNYSSSDSGDSSSSSSSYAAPSPQPKTKKTVILAIPVKLALQQPGQERPQQSSYAQDNYPASQEQDKRQSYEVQQSRPYESRYEQSGQGGRDVSYEQSTRPSYSERPSYQSQGAQSTYGGDDQAYPDGSGSYGQPSYEQKPTYEQPRQEGRSYGQSANGPNSYERPPAYEQQQRPSYEQQQQQQQQQQRPSYGQGSRQAPGAYGGDARDQSYGGGSDNQGYDLHAQRPYGSAGGAKSGYEQSNKRRPSYPTGQYDEQSSPYNSKGPSAGNSYSDDLSGLEGLPGLQGALAGEGKYGNGDSYGLDNAAALAGAYQDAEGLGASGLGGYGPSAHSAAMSAMAAASGNGAYGPGPGNGGYGPGNGGYGPGNGFGGDMGAFPGQFGTGHGGYGGPPPGALGYGPGAGGMRPGSPYGPGGLYGKPTNLRPSYGPSSPAYGGASPYSRGFASSPYGAFPSGAGSAAPKVYMPATGSKDYYSPGYAASESRPTFRLASAVASGLGLDGKSTFKSGFKLGNIEFGTSSFFPSIKIKSPIRIK